MCSFLIKIDPRLVQETAMWHLRAGAMVVNSAARSTVVSSVGTAPNG